MASRIQNAFWHNAVIAVAFVNSGKR